MELETRKTDTTPVLAGIRRFLTGRITGVTIVIAFFLIVVIFSVLSPLFLSPENLINIANESATTSVIAFGMTMVLVSGGLDLSVGSMMSLSAVLCAHFLGLGTPIALAMLISLAVGALSGFINGFLSVQWEVQSFLITLGSMSILQGLALIISGGMTLYISATLFLNLTGQGFVGPIPVLFAWTLLFFVISLILMNRTTFGRRIRAIGGNLTAARQAGVRTKRLRITVFIISGTLAAFSGLMVAGRLSSGLPNVGSGMMLDAIAASVLGGTGFKGEGGSIVGTLFGALVLGTIINGLTILGVDPYIQQVVKGVIIILAVLTPNLRKGSIAR